MPDRKSPGTEATPARARKGHERFGEKRALILDAATRLLNARGLAGLTLVDVGEVVGLGTSSITYYFRRKELLAAAVFEHSLARMEAMVAAAAGAATARQRVAALLKAHFRLLYRIQRGEDRPLAVLSEMRALDNAVGAPILAHYQAIFRQIRALFGPAVSADHIALNTARAQILSETLFWAPAWLFDYAYAELDGICDELLRIFDSGLGWPDASWSPVILERADQPAFAGPRADFLRVANQVISERGYRGASIKRISAERSVSKGSFYHHHGAKDGLVLDCFRHSFETVAAVIAAAGAGTGWARLTSAVMTLLSIQLDGEWPLMRTTALQTLPVELRADVVAHSNRINRSMARLIANGSIDGSMPPVDPLLAAMIVMPGIDAALEQRHRAARMASPGRLTRLYAHALICGLYDDGILHDQSPPGVAKIGSA